MVLAVDRELVEINSAAVDNNSDRREKTGPNLVPTLNSRFSTLAHSTQLMGEPQVLTGYRNDARDDVTNPNGQISQKYH